MGNKIQLFRYRSLNSFLFQELELSEVYAAAPETLNDPFDCQIDAVAAVDRAIDNTEDSQRLDALRHIRDQLNATPPQSKPKGVCCFSNVADSMTMWAHYAGAHTGVCLMYEFDEDYLLSNYHSSRADPYLVSLANVIYGENPYSEWLLSGNLDEPISGHPAANAAAKTLVMKSDNWQYESEVRLTMSRPSLVGLPRDSVKQIAFGLRTPESSKRALISIATRTNPSVGLAKCELTSDRDFGLKLIDI